MATVYYDSDTLPATADGMTFGRCNPCWGHYAGDPSWMWWCSLDVGHDGPHVAMAQDVICAIWED